MSYAVIMLSLIYSLIVDYQLKGLNKQLVIHTASHVHSSIQVGSEKTLLSDHTQFNTVSKLTIL